MSAWRINLDRSELRNIRITENGIERSKVQRFVESSASFVDCGMNEWTIEFYFSILTMIFRSRFTCQAMPANRADGKQAEWKWKTRQNRVFDREKDAIRIIIRPDGIAPLFMRKFRFFGNFSEFIRNQNGVVVLLLQEIFIFHDSGASE